MHAVLILNASYEPLELVPARRAIILLLQGKAVALDASEKFVGSPENTLNVPYVIQLTYMVKPRKRNMKDARFSRHGMFARDNGKCVYCGKPAKTVDHVIPQSRGGETSYRNCVSACYACNFKKSDRSLEEMGWTIPSYVFDNTPSALTRIISRVKKGSNEHVAWSPYIFMYEPQLEAIFG